MLRPSRFVRGPLPERVGTEFIRRDSRRAKRESSLVRSRTSSRPRRKHFCTVENGGKSFRRSRHAPPERTIHTKRVKCVCAGLSLAEPMRFGDGVNDAISAYPRQSDFHSGCSAVSAGRFGPGHRDLCRINPTESQSAEITLFFFGRT